jgi:hypothetical protein
VGAPKEWENKGEKQLSSKGGGERRRHGERSKEKERYEIRRISTPALIWTFRLPSFDLSSLGPFRFYAPLLLHCFDPPLFCSPAPVLLPCFLTDILRLRFFGLSLVPHYSLIFSPSFPRFFLPSFAPPNLRSGRSKESSSGVAKEGGTKRPWGERSKEKGRDEGLSADAKEHFVEKAKARRSEGVEEPRSTRVVRKPTIRLRACKCR